MSVDQALEIMDAMDSIGSAGSPDNQGLTPRQREILKCWCKSIAAPPPGGSGTVRLAGSLDVSSATHS